MGVNEIHDGRQSLLTQRLENLRRVKKQEGNPDGGGRNFQQVFEFNEQNEDEKDKEKEKAKESDRAEITKDSEKSPPPPPRALSPVSIANSKRDEAEPGQIIDLEA